MADRLLKNIDLNGHSYEIDAKYLGGKNISDIENCVKITYAKLKSLRDSSNLIPGKQYRITDYITSTSQKNTKSAGHQFDIIVTADDVNRLNEKARAIQNEEDTYFKNSNLSAWEIWYCLDNDTNRFAWASDLTTDVFSSENLSRAKQIGTIQSSQSTSGTGTYKFGNVEPSYIISKDGCRTNLSNGSRVRLNTIVNVPIYLTLFVADDGSGWCIGVNDGSSGYLYTNPIAVYSYDVGFGSPIAHFAGKGVIYRMIDEFGNDCPYDFKNIMFKRYALNAPIDITDDASYSTNSIYLCRNILQAFKSNLYSYIWSGIDIDNAPYYWDYGAEDVYSNYIYDNTFDYFYTFSYIDGEGAYPKDHSIDGNKNNIKYCHNNVIENYYVQHNKILSLNNNIFFNTSNQDNCYYNTFGKGCNSNSFGKGCNSNSFGNNCNSNSFGNNCYYNSFGNSCYSNSFGNYCYYNSFGNNCNSNSFGNYCISNSFGNYCNYNSFGNNCNSNSFRNYCYSNSFGNYCNYNSFGNNCTSNSFGNTCNYNSFGNSCDSNSFGNNCDSNSFGNNCDSNSFGNNCISNSFGNSCYYNSFGNYCNSNSFGNYCSYITFGANDTTIKSYYRYIKVEDGNRYIYLNCSVTLSSSNYFQNVRILLGANNATSSTGSKYYSFAESSQTYERHIGSTSSNS